jgi:hypothetical protein
MHRLRPLDLRWRSSETSEQAASPLTSLPFPNRHRTDKGLGEGFEVRVTYGRVICQNFLDKCDAGLMQIWTDFGV